MNSTINFEDILDIQEVDVEEMMMLLDQNVDPVSYTHLRAHET